MDLEKQFVEAAQKVLRSDEFTKHIETTVAKCLNTVVTDTLSRYSEFGNSLEEAVKKSLALHGNLDLPSYNHTILQLVRNQLEQSTQASIQREVADRMKELLVEPPAEIKLSALVEKYREHLNDKVDGGCVCHGENRFYLDLKESDYGFRTLMFSDSKPESRYPQPDISIGVTKEGEVYHLAFRNENVEKQMFAGNFYGFERMLFQMRVAKSRIDIDCDPEEIDTHYGAAYVD